MPVHTPTIEPTGTLLPNGKREMGLFDGNVRLCAGTREHCAKALALRTAFAAGERVIVDGFTHGTGAFIEYGDPAHACSPDHVSSPCERIAYVEMDRYGRSPIWEGEIRSAS